MEENERIIFVDTETTNSIDDPICYDVGFAVSDKEGNIYEEQSFVVAEIFLDEELMASAYFIDKIPQYWEEIKQGKRKLARFNTIRLAFAETCARHNITKVCAHNARFDYRSLNLTQRFLTSSKYRYFFPYGVEIWDTLKMSREVLKNCENYEKFCAENNFLTKNKAKQFTAEVLFRFITNNVDFTESHTGLEDVLIEKDIFSYCMTKNPELDGALWAKR